MTTTTTPCYLGIDVGTQGLTALLAEDSSSASEEHKSSLNVLAIGEGSYGFVPDLPEGCYEQDPLHWETALLGALRSILDTLKGFEKNTNNNATSVSIDAICVTGQMHGCVMIDQNGNNIGNARLWCDARNQEEADELSELFGERMPKRLTAARYLWSLQHEPFKTQKCVGITTPAGYIAHKLTTATSTSKQKPQLVLGVGEASGMFPIDTNGGATGCDYRSDWIESFDGHIRSKFPGVLVPSLRDLLPKIRTAGDTRNHRGESIPVVLDKTVLDPGGWLHNVRDIFGGDSSSSSSRTILVAPSEGDQPTALAASLIGQHGMISCSFGTSVVANMVGKSIGDTTSTTTKGNSLASVDRFNAVNGQPISMVWLRNGTTYLNRMIDSYGGDFEGLLRQAVEAPPDCGGLLALPFLDDEPGLNVARGGTGMVVGFSSSNNSGGNTDDGNHKAGNVIKAAMVSVMFNLYLGTQQVEKAEAAALSIEETHDAKGSKKEIVLTGGLTKTPETGQILADIFDRPVRLLEAADEGGAWGATLLAKYSHVCEKRKKVENEDQSFTRPHPDNWLAFLTTIEAKEQQAFFPQPENVQVYSSVLEKYKKLLELQPQLDRVMNGP